METTQWALALAGAGGQPGDVVAAIHVVIGPVHRLAWDGEDEAGDRRRALTALLTLVSELRAAHPALAAVVDWWLLAALGEKGATSAWEVERQIPSATGEVLRGVLALKGDRPLQLLRRPVLLAAVLDRLEVLTSTHTGKIAPAVRILKQANSECNSVVVAAREGKAKPKDLRLAGLSENALLAWASEEEGGRRVDEGTPVWNHVIAGLRERADLVDEALALWPSKNSPRIELPKSWETDLEEACAPHSELAATLVADLLADPPERALLRADLARYRDAPPLIARWAVYGLAREAFSLTEERATSWMRECERELDALTDEVARLRARARGDLADIAGFVDEAAGALDRLEVAVASDWLSTAREELGKATQDASTERRRTALQERIAELSSLGHPVAVDLSDLDGAEGVVNASVSDVRRSLQRALDDAAAELARCRCPDEAAVATARNLLGRSLPAAHEAVERLRNRAAAARVADDSRLGPTLASLRDQIAGRPERDALNAVLEIAARRHSRGLDPAPVVRDLEAHLAVSQPATVAVEDLRARELRRVAFVPSAARASGPDTRNRLRVHGVWVCGSAEGAERVKRWGEASAEASSTFGESRFYAVEHGRAIGPFVEDGEYMKAEHPWEAVASMPVDAFRDLFGAVDVSEERFLVPWPPSLEEMLAAGADAHDEMDDQRLADWLARELDGAPDPERIARWLQDAEAAALPPAIREARFARMHGLLGRAHQLEDFRDRAVTSYLATEDGQAAIARAAETVVQRDEGRIRDQVALRRATLEGELATLEHKRSTLSARLAEDERVAGVRLSELRGEIADAEALLEDRKLALLARFSGSTSTPNVPSPKAVVATPIRAVPFPHVAVPPLRELVELVAHGTWGSEEVANLLVSTLTGRWTLLAGLPGVGKSTFVRSVLSRLGHGPESGRFLELVVRRDWQDDTPLFGFWHPTHHAWEPSSEGFVEHLLRASDDHAAGHGGVYPVLIEELNLASPEYYLARPISALEAARPAVRLYDPELAPSNAARYPATFAIPDAVRLLATVNVDDTVERLSPRFLSRASVIWVEPQPEGPTWRAEDDAPRVVVRWDALSAAVAGPPGELGDVEKLLRFLVDRRVPGAPTARTRAAMARYLGASRGLLDRKKAEDFQILQRVLPPLRGVGPRWRALLEEMVKLLARHGWTLSAERASDLRERGEELGDWYDFFHT